METKLIEKLLFATDSLDNEVDSNSNNFCNGPFWNSTLTWHTNDPDITECFRDTILVGFPCAFLWIFGLPIWIWSTLYNNASKNNFDKTKVVYRVKLKGKQ